MVERAGIMIHSLKIKVDSLCYMIESDLGLLWLAVNLAR
jgi:hypothetical protein